LLREGRSKLNEGEIVKLLEKENEEFRTLGKEHKDLDDKLSELQKKVYLSSEEQMEKKKLKKLKLLKKDRRAELIRKYRQDHTN
jgi:formyltetrahydrofolate synthetase